MKNGFKLTLVFVLSILVFGNSSSHGQSPTADTLDEASYTIPPGQKFVIRLETDLHSRITQKGERVDFKTAAEIPVDNLPVIERGTLIRGTVIKCKRAGRLFGHAEMVLRLDDIQLPDGTFLRLPATITRVGFDPLTPKGDGGSKIEGEPGKSADAGAIVKAGAQGVIVGVLSAGSKGAIYGGAATAAIAAAGMLLRRGPDIDLPRNTIMEARLDKPLRVPARLSAFAMQQLRNAEVTQQEAKINSPADSSPQVNQPAPERRSEITTSSSEPATRESPPSALSVSAPGKSSHTGPAPNDLSANANFRVKVSMVLVDAVVKNRAGRMMSDLTRDDFRVYEDGALQTIAAFSFDELPLAAALVVDRSGSVAPYLTELRRIAARILQQLKSVDQVALFSFAGNIEKLEDLTTDRRRIAEGLARIHAGGGTNINDALFQATVYLSQAAPDSRHAVILISDNQATVTSRASASEVICKALDTNTTIYSIKIQGGVDPWTINLPSLISGGEEIERIARETGGVVLKASKISSLDTTLASVISHLRMRYSLGYYPSNTTQGGSFHTIEVRLDERYGRPGKDYYVEAKRGYYSISYQDK